VSSAKLRVLLGGPLQRLDGAASDYLFTSPSDWDARTRKRGKAALADTFYAQPATVGTFQDRGIRYERRHDEEAELLVHLGLRR